MRRALVGLGVWLACFLPAAGPPAAAAQAPPPVPEAAVVDDGRYDDASAGRAAWRPMAGSPDVVPVEADGRRALRMACPFAGTRIERASWDRAVRLDMTSCRGLRLAFRCTDPSPVSHFSLYFQSGEGWYAASFAPAGTGGWESVTVRKEDTRIEGRPAGWGHVSALRLSAWRGRGADTEFFVADVALEGRGADVVVVRGESAARLAPSEVESAVQYSGAMAAHLDALGLGYALWSDLDVTADRLRGRRLVLLPHNPVMPESAVQALAGFLEGGGRLVAFYTLPGALAQAAGVALGPHVREARPGQFSAIRFGDGAPAGAPPQVAQRSWNLREARPVEGRGRVVARWLDQDGRDTGYPAVVASDRCLFMTHVLLPDDLAAKRRMLLAMVGHFEPAAWAQAVAHAVAHVGRFGPHGSFGEAREAVLRRAADRPQARAALEPAARGRAEAVALSSQGRHAEALAAAESATRQMVEAWCRVQRAAPGEFRAFWCHSAFGPAGMTWDESIRRLAENGFTAILPNMLWGGVAYYESRVLPVAPEVRERGDQVAQCVAACRKHGLQCHVWKVNWNLGSRVPKEFAERLKRDGRSQVRFDGAARDGWLCPSHPQNQRLEIESMVEVAARYDVDGIHFDYIRYPDRDGCFCAGCRERFEKAVGAPVADWPAGVRRDAALEAKWLDFRREQITRVVAAVHEAARKVRPGVKISAAVFRNWPADRDSVGQDWKVWCDRGYLDFVCPMDYTPHNPELERMVASQLQWAGRVPCYPGIGLSVWPEPADVVKLIEQVTIARRLGARGFTVFEYRAPEARDVVPRCGMGLTAPPAGGPPAPGRPPAG